MSTMVDKSWAVVVTTAPREDCTLATSISSIKACGWDPVVFAEPGSTPVDCLTVKNSQRLGAWHNFLSSVRWALRSTDASVILTAQDDALFHPDSKNFIESVMWPSDNVGFISLYTPSHYSVGRVFGQFRDPGVNCIKVSSLWGACALVWPRAILEQFMQHPICVDWLGAKPRSRRSDVYCHRKENPHLIANVDTAIGNFINAINKEMYFVDPSAVQHIALHSTIGHGGNTGRRNAMRIASHHMSLAEQVPTGERV